MDSAFRYIGLAGAAGLGASAVYLLPMLGAAGAGFVIALAAGAALVAAA